jgi:hypothetical protein
MGINNIKLRHLEKLIDLTFLALPSRPVDPTGMQSNLIIFLKDKNIKKIFDNIISSGELWEKYEKINAKNFTKLSQALGLLENENISDLTPRARVIYLYFKEKINS